MVATAATDDTLNVSCISRQFLLSTKYSASWDEGVFRGRIFSAEDETVRFVDLEMAIVDALAYDVVLGSDWRLEVLKDSIAYPMGRDSVPSPPPSMEVDEGLDHSAPVREDGEPREAAASVDVRGYGIIHANIFGEANAVNVTSLSYAVPIFKANIWQLKHLMSLHGLEGGSKDLNSCRLELLSHLLTGGCVLENVSFVGCRLVGSDYTRPSEISLLALRDLNEPRLASVWPTVNLRLIAAALDMRINTENVHLRSEIQSQLRDRLCMLQAVDDRNVSPLADLFQSFERHNRATLLRLCSQHSIPADCKTTSEELRHLLCEHLVSGGCTITAGTQCLVLRDQWVASASRSEWDIFFLTSIVNSRIALKPMQRLLKAAKIPFRADDSLSRLRSTLKSYINTLSKGKGVVSDDELDIACGETADVRLEGLRINWPPSISATLKDELIQMFQEQTSSNALSNGTCASCAEDVLKSELAELSTEEFDYELLKRPDYRDKDLGRTPVGEWLDVACHLRPSFPCENEPTLEQFRDILLDRSGISKVESERCLKLQICKTCHKALKMGRVPALALANRTFLGDVPEELQNLTIIEEAMIARCRAKCWIIQLKEEYSSVELPNNQRGVKGHIVIYPQNTSEIVKLLPPPVEEITSPICVLFVGSQPPTAQWLRENAKPLAVRPAVVRRALMWLKVHNPLYKDIVINDSVLDGLAETEILPFTVQHIQTSAATETQTSRYDGLEAPVTANGEVSWQNVVIANVDGEASSNALRAAAFRHVNNNKGGYIQIPHDSTPVNEFIDPKLFPMIYPTLFPYGIGGFKDSDRETPLSMQRHVKHLFNLNDRRFQEHYSFLFTAFNMLQRHSILLYTKLKTQQSNFDKLAVTLADVDAATIHTVIERMGRGESVSENWTANEAKLFTLMREVSALSSNVPGSASARTTMRNEIRALMVDKGLPNFYVTINPADVYNPIVNLLAGSEIDVDDLLDKDLPGYWEQSTLVAKNPAVAAKFFNVYMKAFISCLLRYDPNLAEQREGVLGIVKAYYGCVEAQGRGTLHCHMLIWLEGGLNPNELKEKILADEDFKRRLVAYLDDTISNFVPDPPKDDIIVPSDRHHPCSVRGVKPNADDLSRERKEAMRGKDMHNLVKQCQSHVHTRTCYKYFKGAPGERKECRFDLDEDNVRPVTSVDPETGEIQLRKLNGMVNNFNATILEAVRCNMDIQFIGSGVSAKAMIYYMTDYITKSSLKAHVALGALELAVQRLGTYVADEEDSSLRAKVLLRRCAYMMLSHQELSAQQVASYIMGYEDHFKSHDFVTLFWPSCERFIDFQDPSPECRGKKKDIIDSIEPDDICGAPLLDEDEPDDGTGADMTDLEDNCPESSTTHLPPDEEVQVSVDSDGQLVASASLTEDYRFRGRALKAMNLWEFRARIHKVKMSKGLRGIVNDPDAEKPYFLNRKQIYIPLMKPHKQSETHVLRFTPFGERRVPVPTGPSIPRRDSVETFPRFCRLMLLLFKPWFSAQDLRGSGESWHTAYENFLQIASLDVRLKIENTQVLHECRDSRDNHFAQRRNRRRSADIRLGGNDDERQYSDGMMAEATSHEELLEHLQQVQSCYEDKTAANQHKMLECLSYAEKYGIYDTSHLPYLGPSDDSQTRAIRITDESMEDAWELEYEKRRDMWKKKVARPDRTTQENQPASDANVVIHDGSSMRDAQFQVATNTLGVTSEVPHIQANLESCVVKSPDILELVSSHWSLNREQHRAFRIVVEHSFQERPSQLRMFLGGFGGAGKSRVIKALCDFFQRMNQRRRLRLASYTGVAARNIQGVTLHASLFINQRTNKGVRSKTLRDLIAVWEGVDYLVIDEVSMIGCALMLDISKSLSDAKSNPHPFGGVNVIFAGDFAQLPPVCETRLYARLNPRSTGGKSEQKKILGKLLWFGVDTVVILAEVMRQCGQENQGFVELLGRLRNGRCSLTDFSLLNSRLISTTNAACDSSTLMDIPILVTQNSVKDFLNEKGAESFSRRTKRSMHWYYAIDKISGNIIDDERLKAHLRGLSTSHTSQRLGRLPLVIGMPVMITQNFDVEHGIVNGSMGTLKTIRYVIDKYGDRHATSCVVEIPDMSGPKIANLGHQEAAVIRDTVSMTFRHPFSGKNCTIRRVQLPLVPAFCLTAHKSQGQTLERVIVDLEDCRGTEAPYVMLSRVKSLEGLHILRPFQYRRITVHPSQESRIENQRLEILRLQTLQKYGSDTERQDATQSLHGACLSFPDLGNLDVTRSDSASKRLLTEAQQTVLEQAAILENREGSISTAGKRTRADGHATTRRVRQRIR